MNIDQKSKQLICDYEQSLDLAARLAHKISPPFVIELVGDLGGGKTTFVKALGKALGITKTITSPTFSIHRSYTVSKGVRLEHFDLYRLEGDDVALHEVIDAVKDDTAITVIEWAKMSESMLPADRIIIQFDFIDEKSRRITLTATGQNSAKIIGEIT